MLYHIYLLLFIIKAAITPGTQPAIVSSETISTDPHPLSSTARGGRSIHNTALKKPIQFSLKKRQGENLSFRTVFFKYFRIAERKYSLIRKFVAQTLDDKKRRYY
jgi:hypothetical protein